MNPRELHRTGPEVDPRAGNQGFLRVADLSKRFGSLVVLEEVTFAVDRGEVLALLGPSGSGKSTLLRILGGFEVADGGSIVVDGEPIDRLPPARRGFGMVFQSYALFPHLSVGRNIAFGLDALGWSKTRTRERVVEMLELVDLAGFENRRIGEISGGQQQRVALARALAPSPRLLMLDEPLSNLDPTLRDRTRAQLRETISRVGITTVLVTHEQEEAFELGDRVAILNRGQLEQVDDPVTLYRAPATRFVSAFVGRSSFLRATIEHIDLPTQRAGVVLEGGARWPAIATSAHQLTTGAAIELAIRPEDLVYSALPEPESVPGTVERVRFTGPLTYLSVVLASGQRLEVAASDPVAVRSTGWVRLRDGALPRIVTNGVK